MDFPPEFNIDATAFNKNMGSILKFRELKRQIQPLFAVLNKAPETAIEKAVMVDDSIEGCSTICTEMIEEAKILLEKLEGEVAAQANRANSLWMTALNNWTRLNERCDVSVEYTNARSGIIRLLESLCSEHGKAEDNRLQCIRKSVTEIREELVEIWNQCMVTNEENNFVGFQSTEFTFQLLELHRAELVKWKSYHRKNQTFFSSLEKRQQLRLRLKELQLKLEDPKRFINRAGALLQIHKDMKYVSSALPKCEDKLIKLAQNFEEENGRKILILGKSITEIIEQDWLQHKESIKCRSMKALQSRAGNHPQGTRSVSKSPPSREQRIYTCRSCNKSFPKEVKIKNANNGLGADEVKNQLINADRQVLAVAEQEN